MRDATTIASVLGPVSHAGRLLPGIAGLSSRADQSLDEARSRAATHDLVTVFGWYGGPGGRAGPLTLDNAVSREYHRHSGLRLAPTRVASGLGRSLPAFL